MFYIICIVLNLVLCVYGSNELYKGYQVYNIHIKTEEQQDNFHMLKSDMIDFWRKPSFKLNITGQAMVPPSHFTWFEDQLEALGVEKQVIIEDVYEYLSQSEVTQRNTKNTEFNYEGFYRYDKILDHMQTIENTYESSTEIDAKLVIGGQTDEGRPLVYLRITNYSNTSKPVIIIEGGIIPREWITVPAVLNMVDKVIEDRNFLDNFVWIFVPVVNPDGYEYTHTNLRFWTKSRSLRSDLGQICPGVNINRNFDIDWSISDSSSSPCSHLYAGIAPFSEPESRFIRSLLEEYGRNIQLYISLQNTGGFISYPWQYEKAASGMFRQHYFLANDMVEAIGEDYKADVGSLAYGDRQSGTSSDYFSINEILYAFNIDIAPRGDNGVVFAVSEIRDVIDKVWRAVEVAVDSFIQ
ncbi:carboxypeptidase B-like [Colias croceus]|uniref:carboxypeptidase B-like n=1 Tax=Colias crocea TaxID=72248 RepID=UPI001E27CF68|nr:carboxypeptidase B-like [Colias croceus]